MARIARLVDKTASFSSCNFYSKPLYLIVVKCKILCCVNTFFRPLLCRKIGLNEDEELENMRAEETRKEELRRCL